ncbi:alanine racemase [Candidatus Gillettellia adelgis]
MKVATAVINRCALRHNLQQVRQKAPNSRLIAIVKANAYGHGLLETAHTLQDADCFGVARINEALILRSGGVVKPILLLEGVFSAAALSMLVANKIETVVHNNEQLETLEQAKLASPVHVWMKLDTGMHRLGVRLEQAEVFYQRLCACRNVEQPVNLMSHLSCAEKPGSHDTLKQIACFKQFACGKPGQRSLAASSGTLLWPNEHNQWVVRPGIILYGVSPWDSINSHQCQLLPAMTLQSNLIAVRDHRAGESVGYSGTWVSQRDTCIGVVAIGYGDGYPRNAPTGTPIWLNGREVPIVGQVSMDMLSVDLGPRATDKVEDKVVLWGPNLSVERIAAYTSTSAYELVTRLTQRVIIEYVGD